MRRWTLVLILGLLVACGGQDATAPARSLANATATPNPSRSAAASAATRASAAPSVVPNINPTPNATQIARFPTAAATTGATTAPRASAPPIATVPAASASAPASATPIPQPNGTIPAGWKVYRGSPEFPFVVAYPPDWTPDDSLLPEQRIVVFYGPGERDDAERIDIEISEIGDGANIDVQRDEFFKQESAFCDEKGIEYTEHRQITGAAFAILGATCGNGDQLTFMQVASGLVGGDEWNVLMRTYYDRKEARLREVFNPMLASLNVYARIP